MKTSKPYSGITLKLLAFVLITLLSANISLGQSWYNTGWQYRLPVTITNTGVALTDFQVMVALGMSFPWSHSNTDGSDLRFTASDGETELSYWIESWTPGTSAAIWVNVPSVSGFPATTTIYLYYGNSLAASESNGLSTFQFFDDFDQGTLDASKWTTVGSPTVSFVEDEGNTVISMLGPNSHNVFITTINQGFSNFVLEMRVKLLADDNASCSPEIGFRYTSIDDRYITLLRPAIQNDLFIRKYFEGVSYINSAAGYDYSANQFYKYKIVANGSTVGLYLNDILILTPTDAGGSVSSGGICLLNYGNGNPVYYDDVRVRSYAASEPIASLGTTEDLNPYPPLGITFGKTDVSCFGGSNGSINITVTGGSGNYTYFWSPGGQITQDISGLTSGTYSVHVEDGLGSIGDQSVSIDQPPALSLGYAVTVPFDCNTGLAALEITATGGTPPYSGTGIFQQAEGTTVYSITDAHGCTEDISVNVGLGASWYDAAWPFRDPVDINNPSSTILSDFQVKVELDDTFDFNNTNPDGGDIRFTSDDGTTLMPYWIETWDGVNETAVVWVKIPEINIPGSTIYMYYGNSLASNESSGTATFKFFDGFDEGSSAVGLWSGFTAHDWKYSMHMQEGALYYAINRSQNGWVTESLDPEIEAEFDFMHSQINGDGTVVGLSTEPIYCYGLVLSNLALGYSYFRVSDPVLAQRCYDDMVLVYGYMRNTYGTPTTAPDYSLALKGFAEACKAFTTYGNTTSADESRAIVIAYVTAFTQSGGGWVGQGAVQDELKRDFGVLLAYDVTLDATYLTRVRDNINWILLNRWVPANGGLTWTSPYVEGQSYEFYECHQQWFMTAVKMLYDRNNTYNYLPQGLAAWRFLTDNNYAGIDMYVHNHVTHSNNAFFSYRQLFTDGSFQTASFKGSYEIGTALWGMSLNYSWLSSYQSTHSSQAYNYLDEMVKQIKKLPANTGFFSADGNWIRLLSWTPSSWEPDGALWTKVGSPTANLVNDNGNNVLSLRGSGHDNLYTTVNQTFDNFIFEARVNMTSDLNSTCTPEIGFHYTDLTHRYFTMMRGETQNDLFIRRIEGVGYRDNVVPYNYTGGIYYNYKMAVNGNEIKLYLNDALEMDYTDNGTILTGGFSLANYDGTAVYYDDIRVREYIENEPVVSIGTSQFMAGQWTGAVSTDWNNPSNWISGLPGSCSLVTITSSASNQPHISGQAECYNLTIESGSALVIDGGGALTVNGDLNTNGLLTIGSTLASSGSLIVNGTSTGNISYNRQLKTGTDSGSDWHLAAPPVTTNSEANAGKISTVYQWSESAGSWTTTNILSALPGQGYNIRQEDASDGVITFTGPLVQSDVTVEASSPYADAIGPGDSYFDRTFAAGRSLTNLGGKGWNLLGNPYPSSILVDDFIASNYSATPSLSQFDPNYVALYLFDGTARRYYYLASSTGWPSGLELDETHVQAVQGFFALAMNDNSEFKFTRAMQEHSTATTMLKSIAADNRWPGLQLKVAHPGGEVSTTVVYDANMNTGVDPGYDVGLFKSGQDIEIYTTLAHGDNGVNYTRQALPLGGADTLRIPVGVDYKSGGEVTFSAITVPVGGRRFWLEDRTAGIFTDISLKSYTVTLPVQSYGTGRFYLLASVNTPTAITHPESAEGDLRIWISDERLIIAGAVSEGSLCELFDVQGRKLLEQNLTDGERNTVDLPAWLKGLVMVRVTDGQKAVTAKVSVL